MQGEIDGVTYEIPQHVAVIMDGNGRWAKKRLLPRGLGHRQGGKALEQACEDIWHLGVKYFTVYAFSTENWSRPEREVTARMRLLRRYLRDCIERTSRNNMRVRIIGEKSRLDADIVSAVEELEEVSSVNTGLNFTIALNYGSRDEIVRAVRGLAEDAAQGRLDPALISEEMISSRLDTRDLPDPDLLIRTSGEQRLSNWLLWQLA